VARVEIPNFGQLLAPQLSAVPAEAMPYLLSQLERTAAARYRSWASDLPEHAAGILDCAARETDIADRVEKLFPPSESQRVLVDEVASSAQATYYAVFEGLTPAEQMTIQENAERQGAGAWQNLKAAYPEQAAELDTLSATELASADYLATLLEELG
jgi:hypothetical protein